MKRKSVFTVTLLLLVAFCATAFVGCLKIAMKEKNIKDRLRENGYVITEGLAFVEVESVGIYISSRFTAQKLDGIEGYLVSGYFCDSKDQADSLEEYLESEWSEIEAILVQTQTIGTKRLQKYRYGDSVFIGDYQSISTLRNY